MSVAQSRPFGQLLKHYRLFAGLSQEDLATRAGLSSRGISDLERGVRRAPRPSTLTLLAEALGLADGERAALFVAARHHLASPALVPEPGIAALSHRADTSDTTSSPIHSGAASAAPAERQLPRGAFLGALPEGPIVARDAEVARIVAALEAVMSGTGRLLLLRGEPGVGKTRLAQEATLAARDRGLLVATGRCYEPQQAVAYYPFLEALTKAYAATPATLRAELPRRWPDVLRLLPDQDIGVELPAAGRSGPDEQQRLFWQVTGFLQALAADRPLALLLDDLQWADGASLALLLHLARHTREHRVLLLGTCREEEVKRQPVLRAALRELEHERLVERVAVRRLPESGTAAQIAATIGAGDVPAEFTALLHGRTDGNPFFTQETLRVLIDRGDLYREDSRWRWREIAEIVVPDSVRSVLDQRLAHLGVATREALQEASVLGQTFAFEDLQGMGHHVETEVEHALEEAVVAGLVRDVGGENFGFSHVLVQQALYCELPVRQQRRLHRAAAEAIEQLGERERMRRAAEVAEHFLQAHEPARALPYVLLAGDQARATFAHGEAQRHYRGALKLAVELGDRVREAEALEKLANELNVVRRFDEALALSERASTIYSAVGDIEDKGRAAWLVGWQHLELMQPGVAVARLEPRLEELCAGGLSLAGQARLYSALAWAFAWPLIRGRMSEERDAAVTDLPRALAAAEQAVALAQAATDEEVLARALEARARILFALGRLDESLRDWEAVAASAEAADILDLAARALGTSEYLYQCRGEFDASRRCIERAVALVERAGHPWTMALVLDNHGLLAYVTGDWDQARADFERAVATMRAVDTALSYSFPPLLLGLLCLAQGQWETAAAYLAEPLALAERLHDLQPLRRGHGMLAERDLLEGRPEAARARLEPLLDHPGVREFQVQWVLPQLAWTYLELGNEQHAEVLAAESVERARADCHAFYLVDALWVQAMVEIHQSRWHKAQEALEESIDLCRNMPYPYAEAKALYVYGQLHAAIGEPERAREKYQAALVICERLGESLYRPHIQRALRALDAINQLSAPDRASLPRSRQR